MEIFMTKKNTLFLSMLALLFTGCAQKKLVINEKEITQVEDNAWIKERRC